MDPWFQCLTSLVNTLDDMVILSTAHRLNFRSRKTSRHRMLSSRAKKNPSQDIADQVDVSKDGFV